MVVVPPGHWHWLPSGFGAPHFELRSLRVTALTKPSYAPKKVREGWEGAPQSVRLPFVPNVGQPFTGRVIDAKFAGHEHWDVYPFFTVHVTGPLPTLCCRYPPP